MYKFELSKRFDPKKVSAQDLKEMQTELVKRAVELIQNDADVEAKVHVKIGHVRVNFSRSSHCKTGTGTPVDETLDPIEG